MKTLLTLVLFGMLSGNAAAYYEDHPEVIELADAGLAKITRNASDCPSKYGDQTLTDRLGESDGYYTFCVDHVVLPGAVLSEVIGMKENELENESDYDQRLTALWVLKQDKYKAGRISTREVKRIAKKLNIPAKQVEDISFGSEVATMDSFGQFEGLVIDEDYNYETESKSLKYLRKLLKGKHVLTVSFGDGVELYPGGGFYVTHYLFIVDGMLVYVKHSGWDA